MYVSAEDRNPIDNVTNEAVLRQLLSEVTEPDLLIQILLSRSLKSKLDKDTVISECRYYVSAVLDVMLDNISALSEAYQAFQIDGEKLLIDELVERDLVTPAAPAPAPKPIPAQAPLWPWPLTEVPPANGSGEFNAIFENRWSALKLCGYKVGKTDGMPDAERCRFLTYFFRNKLPPAVELYFGDAYGAPGTEQRLAKMANVIAANCRNFKRNDPQKFRIAISHWERDLEYLRKTYYRPGSFPWPATMP